MWMVVVDCFLKSLREQLLFISLSGVSVCVKKLVMWICFKGLCVRHGLSGKVRSTAKVLFCDILEVICFLDEEALTSMSYMLRGLHYDFTTVLLCMKEMLWLLPERSQFL